MTEQEITALGPAFGAYLRRFRGHLGQERTAKHFGIERLAKLLDERIERMLGKDFVKPLIERMSGRTWQIGRRQKKRFLSARLTFSHRHAKSSKVTPKV